MVQMIWRAGSPVGAMAATVSASFATVIAGCAGLQAAGSNRSCLFQIQAPGKILQSSGQYVPLAAYQTYALTIFLRQLNTSLFVEARLYINATQQLIGAQNLSVPVVAPATAQYSFANPAGNYSCVQQFQVYSICKANEVAINGSCFSEYRLIIYASL